MGKMGKIKKWGCVGAGLEPPTSRPSEPRAPLPLCQAHLSTHKGKQICFNPSLCEVPQKPPLMS